MPREATIDCGENAPDVGGRVCQIKKVSGPSFDLALLSIIEIGEVGNALDAILAHHLAAWLKKIGVAHETTLS